MLSKFSVKKPMTVFVSVIFVILLGIISFLNMRTDLLPNLDLPYVAIVTSYPGASPEKVEESVTRPIEQSVATTSGVKNITSTSSENSSMVLLEFVQGTNMDSVMLDLSSALDITKGTFDENIGSPMLLKINPDMIPVMIASVDIDHLSSAEATTYMNEVIIPALERVEGVGSVSASGLIEKSILITLDQKKIDDLNEKLLQSVDKELGKAQSQINDGRAQLEAAQNELEQKSREETEKLAESSTKLDEGIRNIELTLATLPITTASLEEERTKLVTQKTELEHAIQIQTANGIEITDEQKKILSELTSGIETMDAQLAKIPAQQKQLEENLAQLKENQKQLEVGKLALNQELTKASTMLSTQLSEIEKGEAELAEQKKTAFQQVGLSEQLTKENLASIIQAQNFNYPAGYIHTDKSDIIVKVGDHFSSLHELKNLELLKVNSDIGTITLNDVASVAYTDNTGESYTKVNGNDAMILSISKQSIASTSEVSKDIQKAFEDLTNENKDLHIIPLSDQGIYIDIVIQSILQNIIVGGVLAILILLVFLRSIKPTIIIAFSIPISLMFAVALMYFSGVTLNIISLAGLALGVGMLVDNSIVVIENIFRMRRLGVSAATAAMRGATQVSGAIFASTLTTICVFLPIVFSDGLSKQLFTDMGLTIAYSLLASLIVALTLVPSMAAPLLKSEKEPPRAKRTPILSAYERALQFVLNHRITVLLLTILLLVGSIYQAVASGTSFIPDMEGDQITVTMEMPKGSTSDETRKMSEQILERISDIEAIDTIGAMQNGSNSMMGGGSDTSVTYYLLLNPKRTETNDEIVKTVLSQTENLECEVTANTNMMDTSALTGSGIQVLVKGENLDQLRAISTDIANIMKETEGTTEISNGVEDSSSEARIMVDKNKASAYGLTVAQVFQQISTKLEKEKKSTTVNLNGNDYPIMIQGDQSTVLTQDELPNFMISGTIDGEKTEVKLSEIASISEGSSPNSIHRDNQSRTVTASAQIQSGYNVGLVSQEFEKKLENYKVPEGYSIEIDGENTNIMETMVEVILAIVLAIIFIYLIMVAQFQSLLLPFIILFIIPISFTGGFLGLILTGMDVSIIAMMGLLILSGIIVNNGIVFIDYVNQLRQAGFDKREALIQTGKTRLRPIIMTATTTILGLLALALGIGDGSEMLQPMAIVTVGGLIYGTFMTLFIIPILYDLLQRKSVKKIILEGETEEIHEVL